MVLKGLIKSYIFASALALTGCGTKVEVGENEDHGNPNSQDAQVQQEDTVITGGGQPVPTGSGGSGTGSSGTGTTGSGGGGTLTLTCFGDNPTLPDNFQAWCDGMDQGRRAVFSKAVDYICHQQRFVNLAYDACSWNGDAANINKYWRTIEDTTDSSIPDTNFVAAYSITTETNLTNQVQLIIDEMEDPNFDQTHTTIANSRIYDVVPGDDGSFTYSAELASSAATISFRGQMEFEYYGDQFAVAYDYATTNKVIIKESKFLRFFIDLGDGRTRVIAVDEKLVGSGGSHAISRENIISVLNQRMKKDYENSK